LASAANIATNVATGPSVKRGAILGALTAISAAEATPTPPTASETIEAKASPKLRTIKFSDEIKLNETSRETLTRLKQRARTAVLATIAATFPQLVAPPPHI
jgi:hypothetical protein